MKQTNSRLQILSVHTGTPPMSLTQSEMAKLLEITDEKHLRFFHHPHIQKRHFVSLVTNSPETGFKTESHTQLREKFLQYAPSLSAEAIIQGLKKINLGIEDIGQLTCVSSSGFFSPGLSALVSNFLGLKPSVERVDIVGMGCNAGLNGLQTVHNWALAQPNKIAVLLCCEINSSIYSSEISDNNSLVNSLFGDGVAVAVVGTKNQLIAPTVLGFKSHLVPNTMDHLSFKWDDKKNIFAFNINKKTPDVLAAAVKGPLKSFLSEHSLKLEDVQHWIVHSGGEAILSGIQTSLNLAETSLRHTRSVLRDYGNVASGSFLFSYERLLEENKLMKNDHIILMTMGPGLSIEFALIRW